MSDTNVIVDTNPIQVTVSFPGVQGPPGTSAIVNTGILTGAFYPLNSNPAGYVTSSEGGTAVSITGSIPLTGANFSGIGGTILSISGNYVLVSGVNTGIFATTGNLNTTGSYLVSLINASSAGVSSLNSQSGALNLTGAGNVSTSFAGSTFTISGNTGVYSTFVTTGNTGIFALNSNLQSTGLTLQNEINTINNITGNFVTTGQNGYYVTGLTTGFGTSQQFISFPSNFNSVPTISATLEVTSDVLYSWAINNRSISGFNLLLSNDILETGVYLNVICSVI